jgi:hypothetical protein
MLIVYDAHTRDKTEMQATWRLIPWSVRHKQLAYASWSENFLFGMNPEHPFHFSQGSKPIHSKLHCMFQYPVYDKILSSYNLRISSFTSEYLFIRPTICPPHSCHLSPKTKLLPFTSPCAIPWSVTLSVPPFVHLTFGVPFHHVPLESHLGSSQ